MVEDQDSFVADMLKEITIMVENSVKYKFLLSQK